MNERRHGVFSCYLFNFFHIVNIHINKYIPGVFHIKEVKNIPINSLEAIFNHFLKWKPGNFFSISPKVVLSPSFPTDVDFSVAQVLNANATLHFGIFSRDIL